MCTLRCEFPECVSRLAEGARWSWQQSLDFLRTRGDRLLWRDLDSQRAGLASAMFLGSREELDPDQAQAFLETGTIHLLVISGLNVGLLAACLFAVMRVLLVPRGWALVIVAAASVLYAATTDAQPPVVRATVMVLTGCLAVFVGRRPLAFNTLAGAGMIVLALNPGDLFHAGAQLSFLSVGVLAWLAQLRARQPRPDPLTRLISRTRPWPQRIARRLARELGWAALASLVIWLVVAPLVMARFHLVSPVAVVLGPLLGIPVALAMGTGFGIFAVGWISPALAAPFGWVCDGSLTVMETTVDAARRWPGNHFWVSGPGEWWLVAFYAALAVWVLVPRWCPPRRWCMALVAGWTALGLSWSWLGPRDAQKFECTFLSVGHGAAIVVELPGGQTLLYDAGALGSPVRASRAVSGFLWSRGITHLDAVVISHADTDHYNALPTLLEQFSVGVVYVSPVMFERSTAALDTLQTAIKRAGVPLRATWSGDLLRTDSAAQLEVLHPPRRGVLGSDNANSIVLALECQGRRVLLTGDLESPGLDDVLAERPLVCDVLLAPHHGSGYSDPKGFAAWSTPRWTVVSGGDRERLDAAHSAYAAHGGRVLHTAAVGSVHVAVRDGVVSVDTWQEGAR